MGIDPSLVAIQTNETYLYELIEFFLIGDKI